MSHGSPVAHGRAATISLVIEHTRQLENLLAASLPKETVGRTGPRYQNFKTAWIDIQRVYESLVKVVRERRDHDPNILVNHLIALAGQALKAADDTIAASRTQLRRSSVNVESTFAVLIED